MDTILKMMTERAAGYDLTFANTYNLVLHSLVVLSIAGIKIRPLLRLFGLDTRDGQLPRPGGAAAVDEAAEAQEMTTINIGQGE